MSSGLCMSEARSMRDWKLPATDVFDVFSATFAVNMLEILCTNMHVDDDCFSPMCCYSWRNNLRYRSIVALMLRITKDITSAYGTFNAGAAITLPDERFISGTRKDAHCACRLHSAIEVETLERGSLTEQLHDWLLSVTRWQRSFMIDCWGDSLTEVDGAASWFALGIMAQA
jgi:hypothetical protein